MSNLRLEMKDQVDAQNNDTNNINIIRYNQLDNDNVSLKGTAQLNLQVETNHVNQVQIGGTLDLQKVKVAQDQNTPEAPIDNYWVADDLKLTEYRAIKSSSEVFLGFAGLFAGTVSATNLAELHHQYQKERYLRRSASGELCRNALH